jgi:hypothetical protein
MQGSMAHHASPATGKNPAATRQGLLRRIAAVAASFYGGAAIGKPSARPLARIKIRRAALGFPFRSDVDPPPVKPNWDCDYTPVQWL